MRILKHFQYPFNNICHLAVLLLLISYQPVFAQSHNEQVTIIGSFEPSLRPAQKIRIEPDIPESILPEINTSFTGLDILLPATIQISPLNPLSIQPKEKSYNIGNYLKAGVGSLASPLFLFNHSSKLGRQTSFRAGIEHLSSWINIRDYAPSDWMKNKLSTGFDHELSDHSLSADVFYMRNHHRYYGFQPDDFPGIVMDKDSIAQHYQHYGVNAKLQSSYRDPLALHHSVYIQYGRFNDKFNNFENGLDLKASGKKNFELFRFGGVQSIALDLQSNAYHAGDSINDHNEFFLGLLPKLELSGSFYHIGAALRFEYLFDSTGSAHLYPNIWGKLVLLDQKLEFYANMDGGHERRSIFQLITVNPFLKPGSGSWWDNSNFRFETGIKTGLIHHLDIRLGIQYDELGRRGFLITDSASILQNQITNVFDRGTRLQFKADLSYKLSNKWTASASMIQQNFQLDSITEAWHEPSLLLLINAGYQWTEQWYFAAGFHFESKRYAPDYQNGIENINTLKPIMDANLYASYALNEQLALFGSLNNLLHQRYERYLNYPVQGIQIFGGMSLRF